MPKADDDSRWTPIEAAHQWRTEQTGNVHLPVEDLMEELKQGRQHCTARSLGDRRLVAPAECVEKFKLSTDLGRVAPAECVEKFKLSTDLGRVAPAECVEKFKLSTDLSGVSVFSREPRPPNVLNPIRWSIYVWQPDFEPARPLDGGEAPNTSQPQQPAPRSEDDNESPDPSAPLPSKRGAKPILRQKQIEQGKTFFRNWLAANSTAGVSQESLARTVLEALKFGCSWNTVYRHIVKPVLSEKQKAEQKAD